ncbi:flippase activity-associated protein Agl23 [Halobacterium jilantaiense]|uniref:TIGR03663 family protein n=1 Tax=Halobacterium jilantaiense TaxID=355548 RepID=A0A1I0NGX3_9EURY|nr:flippase activity-associated protein Agl23 [Halobacterium jilantaiense]SEW00333.1 TIGR03663 family protein [Halobacterium jilantaiense]
MDSPGRRRAAALAAVVAVVALALAVRFVALGDRVFHWDEARVGYWILQYQTTGDWSYRAFVHGPFLFQVNELLFGVLGDSNAVARAPVALVGGLLPGVAWLFRTRLDDAEVVALAGLLALNPVLVYYSRFMRNDVLVAAFSLAALGFAVRAIDTGRRGDVVAAGAVLALAFTAKENALVYVGMFVGATALLVDTRLFTARERGESWRSAARDAVASVGRGIWDWRRSLAGAAAAFVLVFAVFYAPRPAFYQALSDPSKLPSALVAGTLGAAEELWGVWGVSGSASRDHSYVAFLADAVKTMGSTALVVSVVGVLGFLAERYVADDPREFVLFAGYWAFASVVVYPAITDISGVWSVTHAVVPLAIPAAVGVGYVVDLGRRSLESDDKAGVALAALVVLALVAQVGVVTAETSFVMPQEEENDLVQFGQPGSDMSDTLATVESVTRAHDGDPDVVFFGDHFHVTKDVDPTDPGSVAGTNWFNRLPLNWYLERGNATAESTRVRSAITECPTSATSGGPALCDAPVVVSKADHYADLAPSLTERGYVSRTYELTSTNTIIVVFVDANAAGYEPL